RLRVCLASGIGVDSLVELAGTAVVSPLLARPRNNTRSLGNLSGGAAPGGPVAGNAAREVGCWAAAEAAIAAKVSRMAPRPVLQCRPFREGKRCNTLISRQGRKLRVTTIEQAMPRITTMPTPR